MSNPLPPAARNLEIPPPPVDFPGLEEPAAGTPLVELAETVDEDASGSSSKQRQLPGHRSRVCIADATDPDGFREFVVRVDNRDYLRWDKTAQRAKFPPAQEAPFLVASFTSWSAAKRAGEFAGEFAEFERLCLEVSEVKDDEEEGVTRPTR